MSLPVAYYYHALNPLLTPSHLPTLPIHSLTSSYQPTLSPHHPCRYSRYLRYQQPYEVLTIETSKSKHAM